VRNPFFVSQIKNVPGGMECVPKLSLSIVLVHFLANVFAALRLIK